MRVLIRVQDRQGRGPWRPGFSSEWITDENPMLGVPIQSEVKNFGALVKQAHRNGLHIGCAVMPDNLRLWFTPAEIQTLKSLGFSVVSASACTVLAETKTQLLIGSPYPLAYLPPINWVSMEMME